MGSKWVALPPLRRGLLTSPVRELAARRVVERSWQARLAGDDPAASSPPTAPLKISLTSHAPRFGTLALTIKSLLLQAARPEEVLLWIGHGDLAALPAEVRALTAHGLSIRPCEDHRAHTKYVHALREFPAARIAICDDDTYYRPDWLAVLLAAERPGEIACRRIHRIALDAAGLPLPYRFWDHDSAARDASPLNFPTGVGGVLLRRDLFAPELLDMAMAGALCPTQDDIWLYWMARRAGTRFRRAGRREPLVAWRGSQEVALWRANLREGKNERQMAALLRRFGPAGIFAGGHSAERAPASRPEADAAPAPLL